MAITVFGLMNFSRSLALREEILELHAKDKSQYPYLDPAIKGFLTLMPQYARRLERPGREINEHWLDVVHTLNAEFASSPVRFFHSDAFSQFPRTRADISPQDGLHLSETGQAFLAEAAYEGTHAERAFIQGVRP
jgi:hypothetical protein